MAVITISRGTLSGGKALAECVAEHLGYRCISREILREAARKYGISIDRLSHALASKPGFIEDVNRERARYLTFITAELLKYAKDGNLVYHGMAGHLLLRDVPGIMRVRVIADMEYRTTAAMEQHGFNKHQAEQFIKKADAQRIKWTRALYNADWLDLKLYDLVINLEHESMAAACAITCVAAGSPQFKDTPEVLKSRHNLWIAADVKSHIMAEAGIPNGKVDVTAEGSIVTLTGKIGSSAAREKALAVACHVPGVSQVISN